MKLILILQLLVSTTLMANEKTIVKQFRGEDQIGRFCSVEINHNTDYYCRTNNEKAVDVVFKDYKRTFLLTLCESELYDQFQNILLMQFKEHYYQEPFGAILDFAGGWGFKVISGKIFPDERFVLTVRGAKLFSWKKEIIQCDLTQQ